jgi:hypothetical protein
MGPFQTVLSEVVVKHPGRGANRAHADVAGGANLARELILELVVPDTT